MVPNGWSEVKLGDVITHQKGFAFKSENYCHDGKRIIRISDTDRNSIHDRSPVYVSDENSVDLERYLLSEGDIILSTVGSRPHLLDSMVGKAVQIPAKDEGALLNQNLVKLSPKKKVITNNYLFSMLKKNNFNSFISTLVRGNANQVSITLNELFSYRFLLPTYDEQRKIAQILSTWDRGIATTEKLIDASKQQKKALMQQLLTGKKRLVDPETGKAFEGDWVEGTLASILTKIIDYRGQSVPKASTGIPLITARNVRNGFLDFTSKEYIDESEFSSWMKRGTPEAGDILFTTEAPMGMACRYPSEGVYGVGQRTVTLRVNDKIYSDFLLYYLLSEKGQLLIELRSSGSTAKGIKSSELKKLDVIYPVNVKEQQKIASALTAADKEIELLNAKLAHFKQEKKALMQQLLTGKRRVTIDDNVAA